MIVDAAALGPLALTLLGGAAVAAGFVDAIAGGGGLITLPALLLAGLPPAQALGANKSQSVFGSGMALACFARSPLLDRRRASRSFLPALAGAALGVALVTAVPPDVLRPLVMALLFAVALLLLLRRPAARPLPPRARPAWLAALVAGGIACYDGFFGPGTGTFLIMAYVWLWRDPFDAASANAKVANFASNLAAVAVFAAKGLFFWKIALAMGCGEALGAFAGAHVTIRRGQSVVRGMVIAVSLALVARLAWQMAR